MVSGIFAAQDVIDANTWAAFDLLLGAFLVLLAHVHDGSCRRAVNLVAVHAIELFADLARHAPVLTGAVSTLDGQVLRGATRGRSVLPHCLLGLEVGWWGCVELAVEDCVTAVEEGGLWEVGCILDGVRRRWVVDMVRWNNWSYHLTIKFFFSLSLQRSVLPIHYNFLIWLTITADEIIIGKNNRLS